MAFLSLRFCSRSLSPIPGYYLNLDRKGRRAWFYLPDPLQCCGIGALLVEWEVIKEVPHLSNFL